MKFDDLEDCSAPMAPSTPQRPTREQLTAAAGKVVPDVIGPDLKALFCGINPGLYTAAVGHHFARPGNRFWPAIHQAGFTPRRLAPAEQNELLDYGYGVTNIARRATAAAAELTEEELKAGARQLRKKLLRYKPRFLAVLGIGAYRTAFARPTAKLGLQEETIGETKVWALPNPSGLNAHYTLEEFARLFAELRAAADRDAVG